MFLFSLVLWTSENYFKIFTIVEIVVYDNFKILKTCYRKDKWELNASLSHQENIWLKRMQIILNCKSQSKDNQVTHCAAEPYCGFWKQPWSEGHRQSRNILCPLFPREDLNKFTKPYLNLQNRSVPNEWRNESEDLLRNEMLALYSLLRPKIKRKYISLQSSTLSSLIHDTR